MIRSLRPRLMDIRDNIKIVADLAKGRTQQDLEDDVAFRYAVHHAVLIITEAVRHLPVAVKSKHPTLPWADIESTGNYLRHEYFRIDPDVMWSVIRLHLPQLGQVIQEVSDDVLEEA